MTTILDGEKSWNLDRAISFHWTWGMDDDDPVVRAVHIVFALSDGKAIGVDVTDPELVRAVWHYDCAHRVEMHS